MLATDDNVGFEKTHWHQLQVFMSGNTFRFYFEKINGTFNQLFGEDIKDDEMHADGTIGVSSFMTRAAFDEIRVYPATDIPKPKEDVMGEVPLIQPLEAEEGEEGAEKDDPGSKKEGKDDNKKKAGKKKGKEKMSKEEIKKEKREETKITWDACLKNRDQKTRFQYCKEQFGFDDKAYQFCANDYCGSCCDQ